MARGNMDLCETHIIGNRTRERMVSSRACPALAGHGISLCGISEAEEGFFFHRLAPTMVHLLACVSGQGEVLVDGELIPCSPGQAYLTPREKRHAYRAIPGHSWKVAWVHWQESETRGPVLVPADAEALAIAIDGLYRERIGPAEPKVMQNWATLVASLSQRIIGEMALDPRLQHLWQTVDARLQRPWTTEELAEIAGISSEHLRRLCLAQMHITPMRHVTAMRMRRADGLLRTNAYTVAAVARLVGYEDPFAFSTAFRRQFGVPPSKVH